jgi:hypothetical protein
VLERARLAHLFNRAIIVINLPTPVMLFFKGALIKGGALSCIRTRNQTPKLCPSNKPAAGLDTQRLFSLKPDDCFLEQRANPADSFLSF